MFLGFVLAFHPDKCSVMSVTIKKQPIQHNYILHNHILESVSSAKYLDITVQSNLKWDKHINDLTSKDNKALGFFLVIVSETINMSDGTATRWNDTVYIITNLVRSLRSASDGKCITLNISD
jgi:hypothetical protein